MESAERTQGLEIALSKGHMQKFLIVALIMLNMALQPASANQCVNQLNGRKPFFEFIDYRLEMGQMDKIRLGGGYFADAFLHFDKIKNKWLVLKEYREMTDRTGQTQSPKAFIDSDIKAADLLESMSDRHPFRVVRYARHLEDPNTVELEYHAGITLEQLLMNQKLSEHTKGSLLFTFDKGIERIKTEMEKRHFDNVQFVKLPSRYSDSMVFNTVRAEITTVTGKTHIWIKPDNIIVDPFTLELFLIDPH